MGLNPPIDIALIGTGNRSQTTYAPLFDFLRPWVRLVAVCDPVKENADRYADRMDVHAFYSLADLVKARPMEAALVVAPVDIHHAISCYLMSHGIHCHVETSMSSLLVQAINHATEHRTQISAIITQLGIEPPDLSGWVYMEETGEFREYRSE